jgi:hypothetical protein
MQSSVQRRLWAPLFVFIGLLSGAEPPAAVVAAARQADLAHDPYWLTLLHYERGLVGWRGLIDEPRFWLSPTGKHDPQAELDATLAGLWAEPPADVEQAVAARFPARAAFLAERLGFRLAELPVPGSPELQQTFADLGVRKAFLIFPTGFLRSPSSMFGHTLLLVQGRNQSQLLSQAINYGAETNPNDSGPVSIAKGLAGGYDGFFSIRPYHRTVQEYSDLDQRDIWEYELTLTPAEIERMLAHVWELRGIGSSYWFFDENCSFNLLFLLDAARPGLGLTQRAGNWVIPSETVRWIGDAGLIGTARYRPSRASTVAAGRAALPPAAAAQAVALARGEITVEALVSAQPDPALRAQTLDLAGDSLHALAGRQAVAIADYRTRLHAVLSARAALGKQPPVPAPPIPGRPDLGHRPARVAVGVGREAEGDYGTLALRAAQHDLLDPTAGYLDGASLTFGEADLRWYRGGGVHLQRLDAVRITSLVPYEGIFRRFSWQAGGGLVEERMGDEGGYHQQVALQAAYGIATRLGPVLSWAFATADGRAFGIAEGYAVGPGVQVGSVLGAGMLRVLGTLQGGRYLAGWEETVWEAQVGARFSPSAQWAFDGSWTRFSRWGQLATGFQLRGVFYF